jgi:Na+/phosphate symporter
MKNNVIKGIKKTNAYSEKDIKNEVMLMHDMTNNAAECMSLLENAFIYHTPELIKECNSNALIIKKEVSQLVNKMTDSVNVDPMLKPYVSVPGHLLKIAESIENLSKLIDKKNKGGILFSDKAVRESTFLLQRLIEILAPTSDIILARNTFLSMYVEESQINVGKRATEYATLHEERLIAGVCIPESASIYIKILEAIKSIAWNSKEIAVKLAG